MTTAIYARSATQESLEKQIEFCKTATKNKNIIVYADQNFSGTNLNRPSFQRLLSDIEKGSISKIIVRNHSRISRETIDFLNFCKKLKSKNIELVSMNGAVISPFLDHFAKHFSEI